MEYVENLEVTTDELVELYQSVGWSAYATEPDTLTRALRGSSYWCTAREAGSIRGLVRVVSDDAVIAYVQDILVHPSVQRRGVGRALLTRATERFAHCRQRVLLTDDRTEQTAFYEEMGWTRIDKVAAPKLRCFVRMAGVTY